MKENNIDWGLCIFWALIIIGLIIFWYNVLRLIL